MPSEFTRENTMSASDLPEPAFRLVWKPFEGVYKVTKPNIGDTDCFTADQLRAYGDKRAREAVTSGKLTRAEIDRVAHYAIESAILAPDDWEAAGLYDFAHAISGGIPVVDDLRTLVARLVRALRMVDPDSVLPVQAMDYLMRHGLSLSPLRASAPTPGEKTDGH